MTKAKTDGNIATRDFTDAGTEKSFTKGQSVEVTEGELANYRAAGLVGASADEPATAATDPVDPTKTDPAKKPTA